MEPTTENISELINEFEAWKKAQIDQQDADEVLLHNTLTTARSIKKIEEITGKAIASITYSVLDNALFPERIEFK